MGVTTNEIDSFIEAAINRLSSEQGSMNSSFYIDLRSYQTRITKALVDGCIKSFSARGINAERSGDGLAVHVNLNTCLMNPSQTAHYNVALNYARTVHGNYN